MQFFVINYIITKIIYYKKRIFIILIMYIKDAVYAVFYIYVILYHKLHYYKKSHILFLI
jgi:hypothetical protein